jgi:hypothetical protein
LTPEPAIVGTYPHPGVPGAVMTAGVDHVAAVLRQWFRPGPAPLAVDIETYGLGRDMLRIKAVVLSRPGHVVLLNPRHPHDAHLIRGALEFASLLIMHVSTADAPSLCRNGLMRPEHVWKVTDTVIPARIAHPGEIVPKTLEACAERYLGIKSGKMLDVFRALGYKSKTEGYANLDIDSPAYLFGAGADGLVTARILVPAQQEAVRRLVTGHPFPNGLDRAGAEEEIEGHQIKNRWALAQTVKGLLIDTEYRDRYLSDVGRRRSQGEEQLSSLGIDPGNGGHLMRYLEAQGAVPRDHPRTAKTKTLSARAAHLETIDHPTAQLFVAVKQWAKVADDYLQKCIDLVDEHGRIHPTVKILAAAHGRDSMSDPPVHQFPAPARGIIVPDPGTTWTSVDWSAQEPRILMNLAGDVGPLEGYEHRGEKVYTGIAEFAEVAVKVAKVVVLGGAYGEGIKKLSTDLKLSPEPWLPAVEKWGRSLPARWGYQAARDIQAAVWSAMPRSKEWLDNGRETSKRFGLAMTVAGRILPIPMGPATEDRPAGRQNHKWPNFTISGSALDEQKAVIVQAVKDGYWEYIKFGMHDELVVDTVAADYVQRLMETPSERFMMMARRRPVIRTDRELMRERWVKPE